MSRVLKKNKVVVLTSFFNKPACMATVFLGRGSDFTCRLHLKSDPQKLIPQGVVWWRSNNAHRGFLNGVKELNFTSVQVNGSIVVGSLGSVFNVAFDGAL